jgi:predicted TPR repeat methyltransferase
MIEGDAERLAAWQFERMVAAGRLFSVGQAEPGLAILAKLLEADPDHVDALNWMASVRCLEGRLVDACALIDRATALAPNHSGVLTNRGNIYVEAGDFQSAVDAYQNAIQSDAAAYGAMNNLAALLHGRGLDDDAEMLLRMVVEARPRFGLAHYNLTNVLAAQRRFEEAVRHARLATELMPRGTISIALMASAYVRNDDIEGAAEVVRRWLDAKPDDKEAQYLLVVLEGKEMPARATDGYIETMFDRFSDSFDARLAALDYQAPALVGAELDEFAAPRERVFRVLDAGCGTGLCAVHAREFAGHLCGVDLSSGMLARAARTGLYDQLVKSELTSYLAGVEEPYDIVFSADTLCYFGALETFAAGAAKALVAGGLLAFTVEATADDGKAYKLQVNGRYQHSGGYVASTLEAAGFEVLRMRLETLRKEHGEPVAGHVVAARKL